jgi:cytochrome c553
MDGGDGDTDGGGEPTGGDLSGLTGDSSNGAGVYSGNNCAGCHCADGSGGCALSAPRVVGVSREVLDGALRGSAPHPVRPNLTDQEIVDLEAYLGSL